MSRLTVSTTPRLISFSDVMEKDLPPVDWVIQDLIAEGDRVIVYGEFGAMKNWLLLDAALHIAAGRPWLGKFDTPKARSVLYVDEEMNERTMRRRIKRLAQGMTLDLGSDSSLPFNVMPRQGVWFDKPGAGYLLSALCRAEVEPEIIIIDALRRVLPGTENEAQDVAALWNNLGPLQKAGKAPWFAHHMRKPSFQASADVRHRASGSTDLIAGADTGIAITRPDPKGPRIHVEVVKCREAEEYPVFAVEFEEDGKDGPVRFRYEGLVADLQLDELKSVQAIKLIKEYLAGQPDRTADKQSIVAALKGHGIGERTVERVLEQMRKAGTLDQPARGHWRLVQ